MSSKWKYFFKKYQNFCIVSGIAGFLLAPFLWPFFLAILVNTLSLSVPVLLVYLMICRLKKNKQEIKKETSTADTDSRKCQKSTTCEKAVVKNNVKEETPIHIVPKQEPVVQVEKEKKADTVINKLDEATAAAIQWYITEGRKRISHISTKLAAEGVKSFSISRDGLCSVRTDKGFHRVAAVRDFPAQKMLVIKKELEKEGIYYVKLSRRYMWITRR